MADDDKGDKPVTLVKAEPELDADEVQAAAAQGMHLCPACGDWLPLELTEFHCAGKGHHYAVTRTSIYPEGPADRVLKQEVEHDARMRRLGRLISDAVFALFIVSFVALLCVVLLRCP